MSDPNESELNTSPLLRCEIECRLYTHILPQIMAEFGVLPGIVKDNGMVSFDVGEGMEIVAAHQLHASPIIASEPKNQHHDQSESIEKNLEYLLQRYSFVLHREEPESVLEKISDMGMITWLNIHPEKVWSKENMQSSFQKALSRIVKGGIVIFSTIEDFTIYGQRQPFDLLHYVAQSAVYPNCQISYRQYNNALGKHFLIGKREE